MENVYQLWDITAKQSIKCRDIIFHEHILRHPDIARDLIPIQRLITGSERIADDRQVDDIIEELYPIIKQLKLDE